MNNNYLINIEKAVLSSIIFNYDELYTVKELLSPKDFYLPAHQAVYFGMLKLHSENLPIDEDLLRSRVDSKIVTDQVLLEILSANPITNTQAYSKEIKDASTKRDLVSLATTIKKVAIEENIPSNEAVAIVEDELYKITDTSKSYKSRTLAQIVDAFKTKHEKASSPEGLDRYIKTGITQFDNQFKGFEPGSYVIIGARPSMGKTSLATQITLKNIKRKKGVVIDSLEMSAEDLMMRMIAQENQESISDLLNGMVKDFNNFKETLNYFSTNEYLHIDDKPLSFNQLKSKFLKIKRARDKKGLPTDVWIIDHIGYVKTNWKLKRHEELSIGSKMLKELAKELGITVIALSQLNRGVTDRKGLSKNRPHLSDLKESGSLEEDGDVIIFPHRDSYYEKAEKNEIESDVNKANILVLKNRNGRTGVITCDFKGSTNSFGSFPSVEVYSSNTNDDDLKVDTSALTILM